MKLVLPAILALQVYACAMGQSLQVPRENWHTWKNGPPAWATPEDIEAAKHLKNIQMRVIESTPAASAPDNNFR